MVDVTRLATTTVNFVNVSSASQEPTWTGTHTIDANTNLVLLYYINTIGLSSTLPDPFVSAASINSEAFTLIYRERSNIFTAPQVGISVWALINPSATGTQNWSITCDTPATLNTQWAAFSNYSGAQNILTAADAVTFVSSVANSQTPSLPATGVTAGDYQFIIYSQSIADEGAAQTQSTTINNGWTEVQDTQSGTASGDAHFAWYDTASFTDDDATQNITLANTLNNGHNFAVRFIINNRQFYATGTPSIPTITQSTSIKRPPRVYLNTTQTKVGATELAVQSYNDAGTSLTFNDPQGTGPTGSAFLGIENTSTHFIDWQAVTVNTGPIGSGTPSITPIEAAGNALRTTVTVTDVANSGETPGAGSETWNDGSSGNVITGTGFL